MESLSDIEADKDVSATVEHHDSSGEGVWGVKEGGGLPATFYISNSKNMTHF